MLSKLETELVWLTKRVNAQENLINQLSDYFDEHQLDWSRGVFEGFLEHLEKMKDQLYFESSRLEKLAWKVVEEREHKA